MLEGTYNGHLVQLANHCVIHKWASGSSGFVFFHFYSELSCRIAPGNYLQQNSLKNVKHSFQLKCLHTNTTFTVGIEYLQTTSHWLKHFIIRLQIILYLSMKFHYCHSWKMIDLKDMVYFKKSILLLAKSALDIYQAQPREKVSQINGLFEKSVISNLIQVARKSHCYQ